MQKLVVPVLLAALGFGVAGCGATKKVVIKRGGSISVVILTTENVPSSRTITVSGHTTTIPHAKPGTWIRCSGGPKVKVPARAASAAAYSIGEGVDSSVSATSIQLTRSTKGTVVVTCTRK